MESALTLVRSELRWDRFPQAVAAGLVIGMFEVLYAISLAGLIFSGSLRAVLSQGLGIVLFTVCIAPIVTGLLTRSPGVITNIQGSFLVILNVGIASYVASSNLSPQELLPTVSFIISLSTIITGAGFFALGYFRLTRLVKYIPYPVIGGFLAGTGLLMIAGAVNAMLGQDIQMTSLPELLENDAPLFWVPGLVIGLALLIGVKRLKHFLTLPGLLLAAVLAFYLVLLATGTTLDVARSDGYLLGELPDGIRWQPLTSFVADVDWSSIATQPDTIFTSLVISLITIILYYSGIEVALQRDVELNVELQSSGSTNLIVGLMGGTLSLPSVPLTALNSRMGAQGRLPGLVAGAFAFVILIAGSELVSFVPGAVLGGLLIYMGLTFIDEWIIQGYRKFSRVDFGIVLLIVLSIGFIGFLPGVAIGLIVTILVFVIEYSRTSIYYRIRSGENVRSNVERNAHHTRELRKVMNRVHVIELQGFIFFGTASGVLDIIRSRIHHHNESTALKYLILDFSRVRGVDASAMMSLSKIRQLARNDQFTVIISGLDETLIKPFAVLQGIDDQDWLRFAEVLDYAVEWCEEELLRLTGITQMRIPATLHLQLKDMGMDKAMAKRLDPYLTMRALGVGEVLIRQGEAANELYFVQLGQVSIFLELEDGRSLRLRTMVMGTVVGEIAFYLKQKRSASVIADMDSVVYGLSAESLERMKTDDPDLATFFNEMMLKVIASRLVDTNQALAAMS